VQRARRFSLAVNGGDISSLVWKSNVISKLVEGLKLPNHIHEKRKAERKKKRRQNATTSESSQEELSLCSILESCKNTLNNARVKMVLDSTYPAVMEAWERLSMQ
jgi:hypothetical protein